MRYLFWLFVCCLVSACGDTDQETDHPPNARPDAMDLGKADSTEDDESADAETDEIDLCFEFELYGDGECHTFCAMADSDCTEAELEAARDLCEEEGRYGDGECDTDCRGRDVDCDPEPHVCLEEERYADGTCDDDCRYIDPDCDGYEATSDDELSETEIRICSGFSDQTPEMRRSLATSVCIGREDQTFVDCLVQCIDADER